MYNLFVRHHITPMTFFTMSAGEKTVLIAFAEKEAEAMEEMIKNVGN